MALFKGSYEFEAEEFSRFGRPVWEYSAKGNKVVDKSTAG